MGWKVTYANTEITDDTATVGEYATVLEVVHRPGWDLMRPDSAPDVLAAWCIAAAVRTGIPITDALMAVNQMTVRQVAECYSETAPPANGETDPDVLQAQIVAMQAMADQARAEKAAKGE